MGEWTMREGGCRCGRLRFQITRPPIMTMACHCKGCQRMTSSAFSLSVSVPLDGFEVTSGRPEIGGAQEAAGLVHWFCDACKSWMFTRFPAVMGPFVNVRSTMLDDTSDIAPFIESYACEKLAWATTPAVHSFERFPPAEAFGALAAEFAKR